MRNVFEFDPDKPLSEDVETVDGATLIPFVDARRKNVRKLGGVFRSDFSPVENSRLFISETRQVNRLVPPSAPVEVEEREGLWLFGGRHDSRFGHFLVETLSRLWALENISEPLNGVVFLPEKPLDPKRALRRFKASRGLFDLIDSLPSCEVITRPTRFERLIVPPQGCGAVSMVAGCPEFRAFIRSRFARDIRPDGPRKLYISRTKMRHSPGHVIFEEKIEASARSEGYEIFHPQEHDLKTQIARYRAAEKILGVEGSAFHMVAFVCGSGAEVGMIRRRSGATSGELRGQVEKISGAKCHEFDCLQETFKIPGVEFMENGVPDLDALHKSLMNFGFNYYEFGVISAGEILEEKERLRISVTGSA